MNEEHDNIDWEDLIERLYAFTHKLLKSKSWFRNATDGSFIKGKEVHDYVSEGIERFINEPEKFDSTKGSLADYIKYNIIRTLVGNDAKSSENKTNVDAFAEKYNDEGESDSNYLDLMLPHAEAFFDQQLDYETIMSYVENEVKGVPIVEEIFLGISDGMKRREIIQEFEMNPQDYDNGFRRLNTVLKNTALKFNLKTVSL